MAPIVGGAVGLRSMAVFGRFCKGRHPVGAPFFRLFFWQSSVPLYCPLAAFGFGGLSVSPRAATGRHRGHRDAQGRPTGRQRSNRPTEAPTGPYPPYRPSAFPHAPKGPTGCPQVATATGRKVSAFSAFVSVFSVFVWVFRLLVASMRRNRRFPHKNAVFSVRRVWKWCDFFGLGGRPPRPTGGRFS